MKKIICTGLAVVMTVGILSGCGSSLDVSTDTVYVEKKGTVLSASVETFDKEYYDKDELKSYIDEEVSDYTADNGDDSVSIESYEVEDDTAKLYLKFDGYADYADFTGVELFSGSVVQAVAEGYDFNTDFCAVEDGAKADAVDADTVKAESDYKVVIIKQNIDVKVDGTIQYVSDNVTVTGKNTVTIAASEDAANAEETVLIYIIYK